MVTMVTVGEGVFRLRMVNYRFTLFVFFDAYTSSTLSYFIIYMIKILICLYCIPIAPDNRI